MPHRRGKTEVGNQQAHAFSHPNCDKRRRSVIHRRAGERRELNDRGFFRAAYVQIKVQIYTLAACRALSFRYGSSDVFCALFLCYWDTAILACVLLARCIRKAEQKLSCFIRSAMQYVLPLSVLRKRHAWFSRVSLSSGAVWVCPEVVTMPQPQESSIKMLSGLHLALI